MVLSHRYWLISVRHRILRLVHMTYHDNARKHTQDITPTSDIPFTSFPQYFFLLGSLQLLGTFEPRRFFIIQLFIYPPFCTPYTQQLNYPRRRFLLNVIVHSLAWHLQDSSSPSPAATDVIPIIFYISGLVLASSSPGSTT
jgi:hypothetical protein